MSKKEDDQKLQEIIKQRYLKKEASTPKTTDDTVYVPLTAGRRDYLIKIDFKAVIVDGVIDREKSDAIIMGVAPLDQKVIALGNVKTQENLKYFYNKGNKTGGSKK